MAEETKKTAPEAACAAEEAVVSDVPEAEKPAAVEEAPPQPEREKEEAAAEEKTDDPASFKEESNKVDDLIDPEKKALDEFKQLIQEALNKHEFTAPPPPPATEEKKEEDPKAEEKKEEDPKAEKKEEDPKTESCEGPSDVTPPPKPAEEVAAEKKEEDPKPEEKKEEHPKTESCETPSEVPPPPPTAEAPPPEEKVEEKKSQPEEIKETIVHEVTPPPPPPCEEPATAPAKEEKTPPPPEEVSIWGVPLLADERSDVILLKFLRARDFKVKESFTMLKNVITWRKQFKIDELMEEELNSGLEKVVYMHGVDKEGHPVCYNAFGEFQDKELYNSTFGDGEKRAKFLRWYIQLLEKNIRKFDFRPDGTCTILQVTDLKNMPGLILFKKDFRQATNEALQLLQDNYPEFVAKQVFINVPWWYVAYNRLISPFLTQRTKSKFVFAGPTKTTETLFKYISPEHVPVQYGGLSKKGESEFSPSDPATEETIKPTCKHTVEIPITEACTLVWEVRVIGWDVAYGAEFIPSAEGGYTWIVHKTRKIAAGDEQVVGSSFKIGETGKVVLTFDNQTSKKKKLLYRFKTKPSE